MLCNKPISIAMSN